MKRSYKRLISMYLVALFVSLSMSAVAYPATMDVLLKGHDLRLQYLSGVVVLITFNPNGKYATNTGSSGTWTLNGEKLCTVRKSDSVSGCGRLPSDKSPGDVWASTDANDVELTASIVRRLNVRGQ